ncbi:hypothetical protein [Peribacillus butanolivorans]
MEKFEMYIDYKNLYANELGETLIKLNEFYSLCEILLFEKGESNKLKRLVGDLGNPNLEIEHFERGSLKGFFKVNLATIALVFGILNDGTEMGKKAINTVNHLIDSCENEQEDIDKLRQNETLQNSANSLLTTIKDNPNLNSVSFIYEVKDKQGETTKVTIIIDNNKNQNDNY